MHTSPSYSDDDVDGGNPQVTLDDDLSSPEEEAPPIITAGVTPLVAEVKKQLKPLVSASQIVLTESEEESDEPAVMEDEDIDMDELTKPTPVTKTFNKDVSLDKLFEVPQKKEAKSKKSALKGYTIEETKPVEPTTKPAKKSDGLLLEFMSSPPPTTPATPPLVKSPVINERRDSKRKKKSKKRRESKEAEAVVTESGEKRASNDPFAAVSSLDAWLNSESTGKVSCSLHRS